MNKFEWKSIRDGFDEEDPDQIWAARANSDKYGRFIWITDTGEGFEITSSRYENSPIITCRSLTSAKRWASINIR